MLEALEVVVHILPIYIVHHVMNYSYLLLTHTIVNTCLLVYSYYEDTITPTPINALMHCRQYAA